MESKNYLAKIASLMAIYMTVAVVFSLPASAVNAVHENDPAPEYRNMEGLPEGVQYNSAGVPILGQDLMNFCLQFVDSEGHPIQNLFVFWDFEDSKKPESEYSLPSGAPTNADGLWKGVSFSKEIIVYAQNPFERGKQVETPYKINISSTQTIPIKLVWDKVTPKTSLNSIRHKLVIHVTDENNKPLKNAWLELHPYPTEAHIIPDQGNFFISGYTDRKGDFYTNLHDDIKYKAQIIPANTEEYGHHLIIDATGGGTIKKTYVCKKIAE